MKFFPSAVMCLALLLGGSPGCSEAEREFTEDGRVIVNYWEHWQGFEKEAMQAVVDDFNASQDRIFVKMLAVSQIDQKFVLATAGGRPPDVAGLWERQIAPYAEKGALTPLTPYLEEAGITGEEYIPAIWRMLQYRGIVWALPSTPASIGLHWNKRMFREAGLDPEKPPTSMAELEAMNEVLTVVELRRGGETVRARYSELTDAEKQAKDFEIIEMGFTPNEPGWWTGYNGFWFGAKLWDGEGNLTATSPENIAAVEWYAGFYEKYGIDNMRKFGASFTGNFASPQNPFLDERIAMVLQGVWMYNFIDQFAPQLEWAATAFPVEDPAVRPNTTLVNTDILVIPKGAKNPDEAFEFIRFVNEQRNIEKLCMGQRKFSPMREYSDEFIDLHPHPYIQTFIDLANSPNARVLPKVPVAEEYNIEMVNAYSKAAGGLATPEEALRYAGERAQWKLDRSNRRWEQTGEMRMREWRQGDP
ncbi:ABC transporter substrate-binding protein [Algisphaera agarilytica]|uniref:sn-glycerol-3-phosphate-binding periplasmic protein UgpB n=1 Tax=Algisphaera agarilytica TaxID=1385975 RepID=A0A7X0H658_9BACT|nr:ABC transporter substrate-binding protein [Algisphaera agarilytica]MBB6428515.1 ABC-type glycerol-3-phosphate transport system substrate-binding protein [Algisphaera agarilytica]